MVRRFASEPPVSLSVLGELVDLASRAPSAGFTQGWDFVALLSPQDRDRFWNAARPAKADHDAQKAQEAAAAEQAAQAAAGQAEAETQRQQLMQSGAAGGDGSIVPQLDPEALAERMAQQGVGASGAGTVPGGGG